MITKSRQKKKVLLLINLLIGEKNFSFLFLQGEKGKGSNQERGRLGGDEWGGGGGGGCGWMDGKDRWQNDVCM